MEAGDEQCTLVSSSNALKFLEAINLADHEYFLSYWPLVEAVCMLCSLFTMLTYSV